MKKHSWIKLGALSTCKWCKCKRDRSGLNVVYWLDGQRYDIAPECLAFNKPWEIGSLKNWSIVGMNHYHIRDKKYGNYMFDKPN